MRQRPSSRLLVFDEDNNILLFKFVFKNSALAVEEFWATPGGAVDSGETFEQAAIRELFEETGITIDAVNAHVAERQFVLPLPDGEKVQAIERFFVVRRSRTDLNYDNHTAEEKQVMQKHKWWHIDELADTAETYFPPDLIEILRTL